MGVWASPQGERLPSKCFFVGQIKSSLSDFITTPILHHRLSVMPPKSCTHCRIFRNTTGPFKTCRDPCVHRKCILSASPCPLKYFKTKPTGLKVRPRYIVSNNLISNSTHEAIDDAVNAKTKKKADCGVRWTCKFNVIIHDALVLNLSVDIFQASVLREGDME